MSDRTGEMCEICGTYAGTEMKSEQWVCEDCAPVAHAFKKIPCSRCAELEKERDALLAVINRLEARAVAAEADNLRLANDLAIVRHSRNLAAEIKLAAQRLAESRYDCHGGPGTTQPACGACVTCLMRRAERAEAALIRLRDCDFVITPMDRMDAVRQIAREALDPDLPTTQQQP